MSNTTMKPSNGTARKSLAGQIDRLDNILDGLAVGLNDAVTMLVRESVQTAVREAVQGVVVELLSKPENLAKLRGIVANSVPQPKESKKPSWVRRRLCAVGGMLGNGCRRICRWIGDGCRQVYQLPNILWRNSKLISQYKVPLSIAIVVGLASGIGVYFAGPWLAAVAGGVGGFATNLVLQLLIHLRQAAILNTAS